MAAMRETVELVNEVERFISVGTWVIILTLAGWQAHVFPYTFRHLKAAY